MMAELQVVEAKDLDQNSWHSLCVRGLPVLVRGVRQERAAGWTEEGLAGVRHEEEVKVTVRKQYDRSESMEWVQAVHQVFQPRPDPSLGSLYLQQTHPPAALESDILIPPFFPSNTRWERGLINVWISQACPSGSRTIAHFDPLDNLLCVVRGSKHVRLFHPACLPTIFRGKKYDPRSHNAFVESSFDKEERAKVYANLPFVAELFDPDSIAPYWEGEVGPGDSLMIPSHWVHSIESRPGLCIAVNFWLRTALGFDADRQREEEKILAQVEDFLHDSPSPQLLALRFTKLEMALQKARDQYKALDATFHPENNNSFV